MGCGGRSRRRHVSQNPELPRTHGVHQENAKQKLNAENLMAHTIEELIPEYIRGLPAYIPGRPVEEVERELKIHAIKLASNENPLGPSPKAMDAAGKGLRDSHRYSGGGKYYLRQKLAGRRGGAAGGGFFWGWGGGAVCFVGGGVVWG